MSDFSLTLVLQFKTSKIINDMAKVQIKSEKVTPFGGIFHVRELFPVIWLRLSTKCWGCDVRRTAISTARSLVHCQASTSVWRLRGGCDKPPDAPSLASSHSAHMLIFVKICQICSRSKRCLHYRQHFSRPLL